jgi:predicted transposase YdaD
MIYEARMKEMRDQAAWLDEAQTKGLAQGIEQGIEQGILQGIQQGIVQGIAHKAREVAIKLREKGLPVAEIYDLTGVDLSVE